MKKAFWSKSSVAVIGAGSWGTALASLAARNVADVRLWVRTEEQARELNSTRANPRYLPTLVLDKKIHAYSDLSKVFETPVQAVIWALPSSACRTISREMAKHFRGDEIILHATKGIEEGTLKRPSVILSEELPTPRIGVISGPNLANEIARGEPAATVVASRFNEVIQAGVGIFSSPHFRVYEVHDVIGVEWAGTLKNILAIASGTLDAMGLGWNSRALLISRGLAEMVRFGVAMGGDLVTFLGLAGVGDLLATCSSPLSRNYRVGHRLAKGEKLQDVLTDLGSTAEGVRTSLTIWEYAKENGINMPITEAVYKIIRGEVAARDVVTELMQREFHGPEIDSA